MSLREFTHGRLTVACHDAGHGPAIVMLHNGGTSSTIWRHQVAALSARFRVVAIDLPGFGASPRPQQAASLDELVALTAALIDEWELAPALLVGNCMGSNIAAGVARRDDSLVRGILAVNPLTEASFSAGRIGIFHTLSRTAAGPARLLRSASRRIRVPRPFAGPVLRFQLGSAGVAQGLHRDPELVACQARSGQLPALVDVLEDMSAYGRLDREPLPPGIPLWIAWGAQNRVLDHRSSRHLDTSMHAEQTTLIEQCGHLPMLERPDAVTALIERLAERTAAAAPATGLEVAS